MNRLIFIFTLLALALPSQAQSRRLMMQRTAAAAGGGGGNTYSFITNATANVAAGGTATTPARDTTGAKLIVLTGSFYQGPGTFSDSLGNTWVLGQSHGDNSGTETNQIAYCINPTTGAAHTFSLVANYSVINMQCFGATGTPQFDTQNGADGAGSVTTFQPGSVSPAGNNGLFVSSVTWNVVGATVSINSSFNITDQSGQGGNTLNGAAAYKIQTSGSAENPTWTFSGSVDAYSANIMVFK